jgi:hypothetical protein
MTNEHKVGDGASFPSLEQETRATVPTDCAAYHLNREPQTMRCWAAYETGPIRPIRINGRLAWPTDAIRRLVGAPATPSK